MKTMENDDTIVVVGMSIKVAGADDLDEFSQMLRTGESQHELIGPERLMFDTLFREEDKDPLRNWYGNFIRDADAFDHKFFKRSPRESTTMDPQQRLFLQAAYQAVDQSGYFSETTTSTKDRDKNHVGVYLGACAGDYEHHAACHVPNAFTATGNLKSFIPGKVSHYFGWTGPSMTFDTACSASAVAIHTACRNLLSGECTAALAGGVSTITNFLWFQNLAGASFLSPTGQCKPFDESADGYCRAEGIACVFLKKMSDAIADGNPILARIASTAVYQNQNCTPLFVPNSPSLSQLFKDVVEKAKLSPRDVSLVEAHGTGTPVGDPAEYESIRLALGGPVRSKPLPIGSVKGHIGHAEGASGVISLIKIIMMMLGGYIPPQASFSKMSHHIKVAPSDMLEVVTSLRTWDDEFKVALINNYGASGSNASMVITQPPNCRSWPASTHSGNFNFPFRLSAHGAQGIAAYCAKLLSCLQSLPDVTLADISFNVNRQFNPSLAQHLIFSCRTVAELHVKLSSLSTSTDQPDSCIVTAPPGRPIILCFGGQVSTYVGLDRKLYDGISVFRQHLDECDSVIQSLGLSSIYPDIFLRTPVEDTVKLQTMLFAMQYSCAKSWIDCGLSTKVVAVTGHSFGEITALCISGALSLEDTVKLVAGRARLVRDAWGPDRGAMMAVEADEAHVHELLAESNARNHGYGLAEIACYNGPRGFTLAGSTGAIDGVAATMASSGKFSSIRAKRLNVTNAFHSNLVEPLLNDLEDIGRDLTFNGPIIPIERATETRSMSRLTSRFVPDHMRSPVFFNHAIQRLAKEHPSAIFLEAGSSSTITIMASRALAGQTTPGSHYFQAINMTNDGGFDNLADATTSLWKQGLLVSFWAHHPVQASDFSTIILPPYQFEKFHHWLELKSPVDAVAKAAAALGPAGNISDGQQLRDERKEGLWTFLGDGEGSGSHKGLRFRINTESQDYAKFISGHLIAQTAPICPATLEVNMAIEALFSLHTEWNARGLQPVIYDMVNHAPLCVDPSRTVYLDLEPLNDEGTLWKWSISSISTGLEADGQTHVEARLHVRDPSEATYKAEFARFERLVSHSRCTDMLRVGLDGNEHLDMLTGRNVYRAFGDIVDYGQLYRGVRAVIGGTDECVGQVHKRHGGDTWLDVPLSDSFSQVGGIWVNCMTDCSPSDMFIATGCDMSMRSPRVSTQYGPEGPDTWHVFARHTRETDKLYMTDVFVFEASSGMLCEVMLGIQYARVAKASMRKMLTRLTTDASVMMNKPAATTIPVVLPQSTNEAPAVAAVTEKPATKQKKAKSSAHPDLTEDVRNLVANVAGIEASEITLDSEMADVGIDSLMGMELAREVQVVFKCTLDQTELMEATSLRKFVTCISRALFGPDDAANGASVAEDESSDDGDDGSGEDSSIEAGEGCSQSKDELAVAVTPPQPNPAALFSSSGTATTTATPVLSNLELFQSEILESFAEVKLLCDQHLVEYQIDNIDRVVLAASNRLCVALVVEVFEELGCPLRSATAGQVLERVQFQPQHGRLMEFIYRFLENEARLIDVDPVSGQVARTNMAAPRKPSEAILQELLATYPNFVVANKLTYYAGKHLAAVLSGKTDGLRAIFGSTQGRELVQALYCEHTFNRMNYGQMRLVIERLVSRIQGRQRGETLKILEVGAGTGGTTYVLAPYLATLDIPIEYTFTDISGSMVANARRKFGKLYPFMRFAVHDIERPPAEALKHQHIIIGSNAVHATHNLVNSTSNLRSALRPDGFLMMLEMTEPVAFVDLIFGLLEGWWLFDDWRKHAIIAAEDWERDLHAAGFGHVDWTDGNLAENAFQKVIIAMASGPKRGRLPKASVEADDMDATQSPEQVEAREKKAETFVAKYTAGFALPGVPGVSALSPAVNAGTAPAHQVERKAVVVLTGATGSLGSHLAASLVSQSAVGTVVCVNRRSSTPVERRQMEAFSSRGIQLSSDELSKLRILEADSSKSRLGLAESEYTWLVQHGTHIVHNAWPMSGTRSVRAFEPQFQSLRNLLDLARDMACANRGPRISFQLVSSIGVVGHATGPRIREERVPMASVLPIGYCEAKWICERMLDETLHKYPGRFRAMVVRPGQIAGSSVSGFWNPVEHFAFLVKSAQALRMWPDFDGVLQWVPVNHVAGTMVDLLRIGDGNAPECYPVYHIDNPVGQPWTEMSRVLAGALGIPSDRVIPFRKWVRMVRHSPLLAETENPAARLIDFLDHNFERMSCGGLILDTANSQKHSRTLAAEGPVAAAVARKYVSSWKAMGFLND
ncbi:hypothetical protein EDB81DRAFT_695655 [Dactylonectria macrodidyma]|uniref:Polyketide synthase n=1 Tax=Dactylonectria macrodidyma TaxID=307937 RepID=A0A9P9IX70_9HYPO|nr:hypothetical protein EDB81DRAFT_695655 [Dactylonectria macrodidyma]